MSPLKTAFYLLVLFIFVTALSLWIHARDARRIQKNSTAYAMGRAARRRSCGREWCPFVFGSDAAETWCDGYDEQDRLMQREGAVK